MFTIFNRKRKVIVDCFTSLVPAYEQTPIVKSIKTVPNWWKKLPRVDKPVLEENGYQEKVNMKKCYGFIELYKRGVVIENWSDIIFNVTQENFSFYTKIGDKPTAHSKNQFVEGFNDFHHVKLISPWVFKTNENIHFLFLGTEWSIEYPIKMLPGVLNFKENHSTNVNMLLPKYKEPYEFILPQGMPLAQVIPLNDDINVEFRNHLVSDGELLKYYQNFLPSFKGLNQNNKMKKRNEERNKSKCPFGFGGE